MWWTLVALSVVTSIDNFAVGFSYSIAQRPVTLLQNSIMALANAITTAVAILLGSAVATVIDENVAQIGGACIFITLGLLELYAYFRGQPPSSSSSLPPPGKDKSQAQAQADEASSLLPLATPASGDAVAGSMHPPPLAAAAAPAADPAPLGVQETLTLALGLCLTNVASGVAAGTSGESVYVLPSLVFASSLILLAAGDALARVFGALLPHDSLQLLSGALLVAVGVSNLPALS